MRSRHVLFKVWLNTAWKETLSEINIIAFSDERSLIQSFTLVRGRSNCYTPKTELQSIRSSADLTAASMISYLQIPYIFAVILVLVKLYLKAKYFSAEAVINGKL